MSSLNFSRAYLPLQMTCYQQADGQVKCFYTDMTRHILNQKGSSVCQAFEQQWNQINPNLKDILLSLNNNTLDRFVSEIDEYVYQLHECASSSWPDELKFICHIEDFLLSNGFPLETRSEIWKEIFKGAHIVLNDNGMCYSWLRGNICCKSANDNFSNTCRASISSHESLKDHDQFRIDGQSIIHCLFSIREEKQDPNTVCMAVPRMTTWFQLERTPVEDFFGHFLDYLNYLFSGENIGPWGKSIYTESNPLILDNFMTVCTS